MASIFEYSAREPQTKQTLQLRLNDCHTLKINFHLWSYEQLTEDAELEKAALVKVRFVSDTGQDVTASATDLYKSARGFHFRYLDFKRGFPQEVTVKPPKGSVLVELEILPWKSKDLKVKILNYEALGGRNSSENTPSEKHLLKLPFDAVRESFTTLDPQQLTNKLLYENLLYESSREKRDFSGAIADIPDRSKMERDPQYALGKSYAERFGDTSRQKRLLVICGGYPSEEQRYVNAFIHSRVKDYQAAGIKVDVLSYARGMQGKVTHFDGVDVINGYVAQMAAVLTFGHYDAVAVHFMHPHMWSVMRQFENRFNYYIFIHGHEVRSWTRSYSPKFGLDLAEREFARFNLIRDFWRHLIKEANFSANYIFVSEWMQKAAEEDLLLKFPADRCTIIHNGIDVDFFTYQKKSPEMRKKILVLRNFDKFVYATDLTLNVLKELKKREIWHELEITICGEGARFAEFRQAFSEDTNVTLKETYLTKSEIREAHQSNGIILIPSRLDSQGVSRDEAMASGLVPATNAVCAIPEFVDDKCALLAPAEDHMSLVNAIEELYNDPDRFVEMSRHASERIQLDRSAKQTLAQELEVMGLD